MNQTAAPILRRRTELREEREERDIAIFNEYNDLTADPEQSRTEVNKFLMAKYNIRSTGTLYAIRKRAEAIINSRNNQ